jgi:hypothetical protein
MGEIQLAWPRAESRRNHLQAHRLDLAALCGEFVSFQAYSRRSNQAGHEIAAINSYIHRGDG